MTWIYLGNSWTQWNEKDMFPDFERDFNSFKWMEIKSFKISDFVYKFSGIFELATITMTSALCSDHFTKNDGFIWLNVKNKCLIMI